MAAETKQPDEAAVERALKELAVARRELAASERLVALGTLVSGVAHEIRTPLTYISNNVELLQRILQRRGDVPPEAQAAIAGALEGVERINRLVTDLRRFTRMRETDRESVALHEVVVGAVQLFQATHGGRIAVRDDLAGVRRVEVDRVQVQQVVLNLLENAAEASAPGGVVRVATRDAATGAELVVADEGAGIPPEVVDRMYEPFFTTKLQGTGLGLSIVRRIVDAHGAAVACLSAPGKGTTFTVTFPFRDPPP